MEKGIWKPAGDNLIIYNQLCPQVYQHCGHCACTLVGTVTSASNLTGLQLTDNQLGELCGAFVATGKFTQGFGANVMDACPFALDYFNRLTGQNLKGTWVEFSVENLVAALSKGNGAVMGRRTGTMFMADAQDNCVIDDPKADMGLNGHVIAAIKLNTMDDVWLKELNNYRGMVYKGRPFNNVVRYKLPDALPLFQYFLYVVSK